MTHGLEKIPAPVQTVLMICQRCGHKLTPEGGENLSASIQKNLRAKIKKEMPSSEVRVVTTSCMSVCPSKAVTISKMSLDSPEKSGFFLLHETKIEEAAQTLFTELFQGDDP